MRNLYIGVGGWIVNSLRYERVERSWMVGPYELLCQDSGHAPSAHLPKHLRPGIFCRKQGVGYRTGLIFRLNFSLCAVVVCPNFGNKRGLNSFNNKERN